MDQAPIMLEGGESMICLVTRIKVAKLSTLIWIIIVFFRMRRRARNVLGLLETSIFVSNRHTVFLISLWKNVPAMARFATAVRELHPHAVRKMREVGAEVWSGHFELRGTTPSSKPWANIPLYPEVW